MKKKIIKFVAIILLLTSDLSRTLGADTPDQKERVRLGAKLWPVYCAQCHNARPGSQFSPSQWDAITMHMRTQSIMPAEDMRAIREFLKNVR
jgi:mono/diheme cytochrome c family protein